MIEMRNPVVQNQSEMALVEGNKGSPGIRGATSRRNVRGMNRLWRSDGRSQYSHAHVRDLLVQFLRENAVPVVNEESVRMPARKRLPELLRGPFRRRVGGHVVMEDSAGAWIHDDEHIQRWERGGDHHEEVAC